MPPVTLEELIQSTSQPPKPQKKKRGTPLAVSLLLDILIAGALLCLFALFHHVLPETYSTLPPAAPPAQSAPDTSMGAAFADKFTASVIQTESSYSSPNMAFTVTQHVQGEGADKITYYVADIYLRDIAYLQTGFAKNTYGKGIDEPFLDLVKNSGAVLAVSGDYYGRHYGPVIRNGTLYRNAAGSGDVCVLYKDGTMKTFERGAFNAAEEMENGAWQAWCFGPALLSEDGKAKTRFNSSLTPKHPRCAIGYYEPGHYALVLVDGRQDDYSSGMTLTELSALFESLGCTAAYNLDGGRSAQMAYNNEFVNRPYKDGRNVSDIIFLGEVPAQ